MPNLTLNPLTEFQISVQNLKDAPEGLKSVWKKFLRANTYCSCSDCGSFDRFVKTLRSTTRRILVLCSACQQPEWKTKSHTDSDGFIACNDCRTNSTTCYMCENWFARPHDMSWISGERYCRSCVDNSYTWCNECDSYYPDVDEHSHGYDSLDCTCSPQPLAFTIPANSHGTMKQDERLLVELPAGFIPEQAVEAVISTLWQGQFDAMIPQIDYWENNEGYYESSRKRTELQTKLRETVEALEPVWQAKRGNYTRRLSAALHTQMGVKLDAGLLSKVGGVVRQYTSKTSAWHVEFTRDLNKPASHFFNDESCWWGGEEQSLCALKHWGGLGMRTYASEDVERQWPNGRAWVQPLNADLMPTIDVLGAHAYVVYNGYGELEGYTAVRLVAYLASKTYKKIESLTLGDQYVNCGLGYLVADQETCDNTTAIEIRDLGCHEAVSA